MPAQEEFTTEEVKGSNKSKKSKIPKFKNPLYISLDMDAFDPAYAPGVSHHEPGGLTSRQIINLIQSIDTEIIGADIVEYNPNRDFQNMTAFLAAKMMNSEYGNPPDWNWFKTMGGYAADEIEAIAVAADSTIAVTGNFSGTMRLGEHELTSNGFTDAFRHLHPTKQEYSWWSYRANARANNKGWRLDYTMVAQPIQEKIKRSVILQEAVHSDHCPVLVEIEN